MWDIPSIAPRPPVSMPWTRKAWPYLPWEEGINSSRRRPLVQVRGQGQGRDGAQSKKPQCGDAFRHTDQHGFIASVHEHTLWASSMVGARNAGLIMCPLG